MGGKGKGKANARQKANVKAQKEVQQAVEPRKSPRLQNKGRKAAAVEEVKPPVKREGAGRKYNDRNYEAINDLV